MSVCVKCNQFHHPDYCVVIDEENNACKCVWCYLDKNEITIEDTETGRLIKKLTKKEANKEYMEYLRKVSDNPNIRQILGLE